MKIIKLYTVMTMKPEVGDEVHNTIYPLHIGILGKVVRVDKINNEFKIHVLVTNLENYRNLIMHPNLLEFSPSDITDFERNILETIGKNIDENSSDQRLTQKETHNRVL